ncbi:MAG: hypothetical protein NFCOHLIN_01242 [Gammaproteobacteria bacterium]|nr:hypothetical protein [Gammaproteobacteria bacterium]
MPTTIPESRQTVTADASRRNFRTVLVLGLIALAVYLGFIAMHFHGNG